MTLANILAKLRSWKTAAASLIATLAAAVTWLAGEATALRTTIDDLSRPSAGTRAERTGYLETLKADFAADDDPRKSSVLNDVVYRVRMQTIPGPVGADLLCWLAAKAYATQPEVGTVDGRTADTIVKFLDANREVFPLRQKTATGWPWPGWTKDVDAETYCKPYLDSQRDLDAAAAIKVEVPAPTVSPVPPRGRDSAAILEFPSRLFVQIGAEAQRAPADGVGEALALRFANLAYQGTERVAGYAGPNELRYYKLADARSAQAVSGSLLCDGQRPTPVHLKNYEDNKLVRAGTLELWIRTGTDRCEIVDPVAAN